MLILLVFGFLAILLAAIGNTFRTGKPGAKFSHWCFSHDTVLGASAFFSFALLVMMLIGLAIGHLDYASFPARYEVVTMTLAESRSAGSSDIERAAMAHKIIDMNKEIASVKYWNDSIWVGWFLPDKVAKLKFITKIRSLAGSLLRQIRT